MRCGPSMARINSLSFWTYPFWFSYWTSNEPSNWNLEPKPPELKTNLLLPIGSCEGLALSVILSGRKDEIAAWVILGTSKSYPFSFGLVPPLLSIFNRLVYFAELFRHLFWTTSIQCLYGQSLISSFSSNCAEVATGTGRWSGWWSKLNFLGHVSTQWPYWPQSKHIECKPSYSISYLCPFIKTTRINGFLRSISI